MRSINVRSIAFTLCCALGIVVAALPASAQWQRLTTLPSAVTTIFFPKGNCVSGTGFAGTQGWGIYKTIDGGATWKQVLAHSAGVTYVASFTFKDTLTGWCSIADFGGSTNNPDVIWKTTDGGETWNSLRVSGAFSTAYYHQSEQKLYACAWDGQDIFSTNDGASWVGFSQQDNFSLWPKHNSLVFVDAKHGIITSVKGSPNLVTNDGGATWQATQFKIEIYSPELLACSNSMLAASEENQQIYRSDDYGNTWKPIHSFPGNELLTGLLVGDAQHLFIQNSKEILESTDIGVTWSSIGGPGNYNDSRICTHAGYLYAGDDHGGVFRYQYSTAMPNGSFAASSDTLHFPTHLCGALQQVLGITATTTCSECVDSVRLTGIAISGSTFFKIVSQPDPTRGIGMTDSIVISHLPAITPQDTAMLTFTYSAYGKSTTKVVVLLGNSNVRPTAKVGYWTDAQKQSVNIDAGQIVRTIVYLNDAVQQSVGLSTVSFKLPLGTSLSRSNVQGINGWSIVTEVDNPAGIELTMASAPHTAAAGETIAEIDLKTDVGTDATPVIPIQDVHYNASDPSYETCSLTAVPATDAIAVHFNQRCGDSTIRIFLDGKPLITAFAISPDPVFKHGKNAMSTLHVEAAALSHATIVVASVTGARVLTLPNVALQKGENAIPLDLSSLSEGAYIISMGTGIAKVIVQAERP